MTKGFSLIFGKGIFHVGKFVSGTWFDNNDLLDPESKRGWGIKIDIPIGKLVRPVGYFWKPAFWKRDKPLIIDYMLEGTQFCEDFFGKKLFAKILTLGPYHWNKRTVWNPWYARHSFVFRTWSFVWPYISVGTPWLNFYVGVREFKVDPFTKDITWCGSKDRKQAQKEEPQDRYYALAPSISVRNNRN